jgi:hypothetical protein
MIAYGCIVTEPEPFRRYAEPGISLVREPDSRVYPFASVGTIGRSYNLLLESAAQCDDLEALVILHPHTEITDPGFNARVREGLADPEVAVLGAAGAGGVSGLAWWLGKVSTGRTVQRYTEFGGGELPAYAWARPVPAPAPVDVVDGFLLVLSPWAVRTVAFDEGLTFGYGADIDYCLQVRAAGRRLATLDAGVIEHRSLELVSDMELWVESHIALARKWHGRTDKAEPPTEWRARARRAEAEREAARAMAYSRRLEHDARVAAVQRRLDSVTETRSWRTTAPLRELNLWRRARAAR